MKHQPIFPFSSIVGQDEMKLALMLNAVNPQIGGVLLCGEKGTAKSTIVRGLTGLLDVPFVNLPLNITEDRLLGSIDMKMAVTSGKLCVQKGILADAHRGFLYVDEVNLLDDHINDLLLDSSASGVVRLNREGVSETYSAEFILAGSMNPEEGSLRSQLLDRFGLYVQVEASASAMERVLLMERREAFDSNPYGFISDAEAEERKIREKIVSAQRLLREVRLNEKVINYITEKASSANVAGHRADIVMTEASRAYCALEGRCDVVLSDVDAVSELALAHRRRPMQEPETEHKKESGSDHKHDNRNEDDNAENQHESKSDSHEDSVSSDASDGGVHETVFGVGELFSIRKIEAAKDRKNRKGSGKRSKTKTGAKHGRYVRSVENKGTGDIAIDATLRAAAPYQNMRTPSNGLMIAIEPNDVKEKQRERRIGNFILFIVDSSGSMGARARMTAAKGAIVSLLLDAYKKRDKVAMISFRGKESEVLLQPTSSVELAEKKLRELPTGGKTPLSSAIENGRRLTNAYLRRDPCVKPVVIFLTDGKGNVPLTEGVNPRKEAQAAADAWGAENNDIKFIVVDTEKKGLADFGLSRDLASSLCAELIEIKDLKADTLLGAVKGSFDE